MWVFNPCNPPPPSSPPPAPMSPPLPPSPPVSPPSPPPPPCSPPPAAPPPPSVPNGQFGGRRLLQIAANPCAPAPTPEGGSFTVPPLDLPISGGRRLLGAADPASAFPATPVLLLPDTSPGAPAADVQRSVAARRRLLQSTSAMSMVLSVR